MHKRNQSVIALSFDPSFLDSTEAQLEIVTRREPSPKNAETASEAPGKEIISLCREIAVAMIGRYQEGEEASAVRLEIREGLVEHLDCDEDQANSLIDLSLELVQVTCYGEYQRNSVELAILIRKASGVWGDVALS
ncbi:MAG: hypothetical protein AAGC68_06560 [Verrucomicrobiota bacterium]